MRSRRFAQAPDLDLVPILNLVALIIPFLLFGAQFVTVAVIPSVLAGEGPDETSPGQLGLTVTIAPEGYVIRANSEVMRRESMSDTTRLPCRAGGCEAAADYDAGALTELCKRLKAAHPREATVVIVPYPSIRFEALALTLDATRAAGPDPLFPDAVIATSSPADRP
jgi:hypothetical protein